MPNPYSVGDEISTDELDQSLPITMTAGETINGATLPVAVYIDDTTNEVYACDGNDQAKLEFIGFAISNSTDGNDITVQTKGVVSGFTGLDAGKYYYVQDDKTIGTTVGTYEVLVGVALTATTLLIKKGSWEYMGSANDSSDVITVPATARYAVVVMTSSGEVSQHTVEVFISRKGKTAGTITTLDNYGGGFKALTSTATWSGSSINLTYGGTATNVSGTAYFYR